MPLSASAESKPTRARTATNAPHSWEIDTWPADVWPHSSKRGMWISRAYRKELIAASAMTRIGKTLVFIGVPYTRWMEARAQHVVEFESNNSAIGKQTKKSAT